MTGSARARAKKRKKGKNVCSKNCKNVCKQSTVVIDSLKKRPFYIFLFQTGIKSTSEKIQCLCTHLSAFGGDFFVAPNPIDFDKVFAAFGNLAESGNFVVLAVCCSIWGLYLVMLVLARRQDKKDEFKVS